jgi:hypothetical protein
MIIDNLLFFFEWHIEMVNFVANESIEWQSILANKVKAELVFVQDGKADVK